MMLFSACRIAACRGRMIALRSAHVRGSQLSLRSLSTTPLRIQAAPAAIASSATTSGGAGAAVTSSSTAVPASLEVAAPTATVSSIPGISAEELELSRLADSLDLDTISTAGSLAELGLGGWSPSGILQTAFCTIQAYGLPWWATIGAATLTFKFLLFPLTIRARKYSIHMNNHMPEMQAIQARLRVAEQEGNRLDALRANQDLSNFMREKNVNPFRSLLNVGVQAPIFVSFFFALRGMANLPLDSMKTGGLFWFSDLTVPDPYYILPICTSLTLFATLKLGAEGGMRLDNMGWGRFILGAVPVIMFPFTMNFPAAIVCYWTTSNLFTLGQVAVLKIPAVRRRLDLPDLVRHQKTDLAISKKGFVASVKDMYEGQKRLRMLGNLYRNNEMRFKKAGIGPIVKTYKYDPTKLNPAGVVAAAAKKQ